MGAGWAAAGGGQQRLGHGEQRWLSTEGAGWDPPGCSRVLQHQGSPAEVPLELAARLDPFGQGPSPLQAEVCRSPRFFTYVPTPGGSGGAMRCTGGGFWGLLVPRWGLTSGSGSCSCAGRSLLAPLPAPSCRNPSWFRSAVEPPSLCRGWGCAGGSEHSRGQHRSPPRGPVPCVRPWG